MNTSNKKYYWITKNGEKIDVDEMSIDHLRNVLKLILRRKEQEQKQNDAFDEYWYPEFWND